VLTRKRSVECGISPIATPKRPVNRRHLACARCHCTTRRFAGRPSLTAEGQSAAAVALALISITRCSQVEFDTCQEPTSRLHASQ